MQIPYEVSARPDTGLYNAKVGVWLFLASEVMLFGGLFSSYVFLRLGADFNWPFHELDVLPGFINTMVLIASSVSVVAAWASLKARRYGWYKFNMIFTLLCAVAFMGIKSYEYYGKFTHYSVKFTDGSVISGHPVPAGGKHHGDRIVFKATDITINFERSNLEFLDNLWTHDEKDGYVKAESPAVKATTPTGKEITLDSSWFKEQRKTYWAALHDKTSAVTGFELEKPRIKEGSRGDDAATKARKEDKIKEQNKKRADYEAEWQQSLQAKDLSTTLKLKVVGEPLVFLVKENHTAGYGTTSLNFREGTVLTGKLETDTIEFNVDLIDLRPPPSIPGDESAPTRWKELQENSLVWKHLPDLKPRFMAYRDAQIAQYKEDRPKVKVPEEDEDCQRMAFRVVFADNKEKFMGHDEAHAFLHDHERTIQIPRSEKRFYSNFSPSLSPYYAIYFLMTGLHGLHVVGGAIVLGWFLLTGRKMYLSNPEHLANRVEVGGLFWHFVDLVWIFLFPLYYLM
jgi:heme/copper-type cytochrome/quinol oxidase subunit 3